MKTYRAGSRESALAVAQSRLVLDALTAQFPALEITLVTMKTSGDIFLDRSLESIGGKGLFIKELDRALLEGRIDFAVHSLKDLPAMPERGIKIAAYFRREDPRDVLVLPEEGGWGMGDGGWRRREQGAGSREQGTGNREQGTGNREQGTGNGERGTGRCR